MKLVERIIAGLCMTLLLTDIVQAQSYLKVVNPDDYMENFTEMARQIDMFYDTATGSNRGGYKQWKRNEWFLMHHLDEAGKVGNTIEKNILALEEFTRLTGESERSHTGDWFSLGHSSVAGTEAKMGRVNSVAFDPVNSAIVYLASAGGGIWKTYNGGDSWINLTIDLPTLGISDIAVSPAPINNIVYALTGDITGGANIYRHNSIGVLKSYDGGFSWTRTSLIGPLSQGLSGYKLLMHPSNPNILFAAMSDGIHRTQDGGLTWINIAPVGVVNDMELSISNPDTLFFVIPGVNNLYKINVNTNSIRNVAINASRTIDRMEIGVTPDNPNAVYLLAGPGYNFFGGNLFNGLFYSGNSGASFSLRSVSCNNNGDLFNSLASFSWYANTLYVDPLEENYIMAGGLWLFNSIDGGVTLNQITSGAVHADQHNIKRNPLNGQLWLCNDGGVYKSSDSGNNWENKSNGLTINEYYRISGTNNASDRLMGGTQDNGHFLRVNAGAYQHVLGGDGMDNYFNSFDNSIAYASSQNGGLARSTTFGATFSDVALPNAGDDDFYAWITPFVQYPPVYNTGNNQWESTDVIYAYSLNGVWRSFDGGASWSNIGPMSSGSVGTGPSMVIGRDAGGTNLYICNGNKFWVTPDGLLPVPIWYSYALPVDANTFVSALAINPANRNEVWITISGYQGGIKVFRTLNAGLSWTNMSLSLPDVPIYSIVFANNFNSPSGAVYVGSEIGVFYKDDGIPNWVPYSNGLPHVPVTDLQMNYVLGRLKAATFGRGIWESDVYESCPSLILIDYDLNQGQYYFESSSLINANHAISGGVGVSVRMKAANQIKLVHGFRTYPDASVKMIIGTCGSGVQGLIDSIPGPSGLTEDLKIKTTKVNRK